jgi:hypothetical protein
MTTTTPKKGDRVRVTYEAEYVETGYHAGHIVAFDVKGDAYRAGVPKGATIEVLTPPVKVGDEITSERQLEALPFGSTVVSADHLTAVRWSGGWRTISGEVKASSIASFWDATVTYVRPAA